MVRRQPGDSLSREREMRENIPFESSGPGAAPNSARPGTRYVAGGSNGTSTGREWFDNAAEAAGSFRQPGQIPGRIQSKIDHVPVMSASLPPVSWKRMKDAVENVRRRLLRAAAALDAAQVAYAVIGGNAVAAWVSRADEAAVRNTRDVDVLLRREDLPAASAALAAAGFVHRHVASRGKADGMEVFLDGAEGKVRDAVHVVFAAERTRPDQTEPNAQVEESEDAGDFRLISLEALVRMKLSAWRDKDRVHLRDLASVGLIDGTWIKRMPVGLQPRFAEIIASADD